MTTPLARSSMLPVVEPDGKFNGSVRIIALFSLHLIPVSMVPTVLGMAGRIYMVGAFVLGLTLLYFGSGLHPCTCQ